MVSIIGAGPGDPELLTVKGQKRLQEADVVIYAGSLVNPALLAEIKQGCQVYNSAKMHLEEILNVIEEAEKKKLNTVRLQTGDPCIYGAIREQMDALKARGIPFEIIPGVSSFCGAAASLELEYTLPNVTQTVILTRLSGRTAVPEAEGLEKLSQHGASMVLFLSVDKIEEAMRQLTGYPKDMPVAVVYKATWKEEKILQGTIADIAEKTKIAGIQKTALVVISPALKEESGYSLSKLYDRSFETEFRAAEK